ncbi:hypothetical protein Taro_038668, partial [Colocasia esculenta]|nr:hypothetical protein [Colocasia esculenta]
MALLPRKGKQKGRKENKPMASSGKGRPRDALGPRQSAAPFKKQGRKRSERHAEASSKPSSSASLLLAQDDEPDFPRGGRSLLTREEEAEARAEAEEEFEREMKWGGKNKKGKKKNNMNKGLGSRSEVDDEWASLFGGVITGKLPRFANRVTLKNISPNMKLWGVIAEVNTKDLVVSLPGGLRGFVRAEEALDIAPDDKHKVLTAQVKSIEDHGYILHFGLSSVSGFLPESSQDDDKMLKTGQLLQGAVKSIDKARRVVILNSDPELVAKCVVQELNGLSIDLLIPGMMVNAQVHATLENGVMLSFLTYFTGTVDIFHLQNSLPNASWKGDYTQKKVNKYVKTGDIYDGAKIVRVDKGIGLLLEIPSTPASSPVYVNMFDIDDEIQKLEKRFKEGMHVRVRILGMRHLDGLAMGTLKASALEGSVFTHSDVKPGMLVKAKVIAVESFGAIVQFSSGVKALCPLPHISELGLEPGSEANAVYHVGQVVKCRIISSSLVSRRINISFVLSRKRDARDSMIKPGSIVSAVVERLTPRAVIVHVKPDGHASLMKSLLRPGYEFVELLVL